MTSVSDVYKRLRDSASLQAYTRPPAVHVGNYPTLTEGSRPVPPYMIISEPTSTPDKNLKGQPKVDQSILQLEIISDDYRELKEIREIVRFELNPVATELSTGDNWEEAVRMYRETMEWSYWFPR